MRWGFKLVIVAPLSIAVVYALAWMLGNSSHSPAASAEWRTPGWVWLSQAGSMTRVRPVDPATAHWRSGDEAHWVAERVSGWPFRCLAFRVVDDGATRLRGGIAVQPGDLVLGPPRHSWRFPGLGRSIVPLQPVWWPFVASNLVIAVVIGASLESVQLLHAVCLRRVRRCRALMGKCPECEFPTGDRATCAECGAANPAVAPIRKRSAENRDAAAARARRWRVNTGLIVLLLVAVAFCIDWRGCLRQLQSQRNSRTSSPTTQVQPSPIEATPIIIEVTGIEIDAASMRARLRIRITAPSDSDVVVSRGDLDKWAEQMVIQEHSSAAVTQRFDQLVATDPVERESDDLPVSAGETVVVGYDIQNRVFHVVKSGSLQIHMPSSTIRYLKLRDNSRRQVRIEDLQTFEVR